MKNLPLALILEKNKLATPDPWLLLLDVTLPAPSSTTLYLARNTEDVVFGGHTYTAFPFELDAVQQSAQGEIPSLTLRISNVTRILQGYIETQDGAVGTTVLLRVVNAGHLSENFSELEMSFDVMEAFADAQWMSFSLGAPNPLRADFPQHRYLAGHCNWTFKSAECGYTGASQICRRTLDYCRQLNNSTRFGGFPGLSGGGVRLA